MAVAGAQDWVAVRGTAIFGGPRTFMISGHGRALPRSALRAAPVLPSFMNDELMRGARADVGRLRAKLDWYNAHGHYTPEDACRFQREIERQIERLNTYDKRQTDKRMA